MHACSVLTPEMAIRSRWYGVELHHFLFWRSAEVMEKTVCLPVPAQAPSSNVSTDSGVSFSRFTKLLDRPAV